MLLQLIKSHRRLQVWLQVCRHCHPLQNILQLSNCLNIFQTAIPFSNPKLLIIFAAGHKFIEVPRRQRTGVDIRQQGGTQFRSFTLELPATPFHPKTNGSDSAPPTTVQRTPGIPASTPMAAEVLASLCALGLKFPPVGQVSFSLVACSNRSFSLAYLYFFSFDALTPTLFPSILSLFLAEYRCCSSHACSHAS